jgi:PAS domain S-box-containing protein
VFGSDQKINFILIEGHDVSDYHRTSAALLQSEARFKTIFEEAVIGIVIKGEDGRILESNSAFQSMLGYSSNELRERDYLKITHPEDISISRRLFTDLISGKRRNYFMEKRYIHKDGQIIWGKMAASLMRSQVGGQKFVIGMVENITSNKQIEADLIELQHRLMQGKDNERLRIAQDLHDGPLQEIIGVVYQVQELENSIQEQGSKEQIKEIRASLQHLMWSVRTICGELRPPTLAPFGLEKTILSHIERFRTAHPEYVFTWKLAHDGLTLPENIRTAFFRIYQEALNNIVRHAQAKNIKIIFRLTPKKAVLEVCDDGVGFEMPDHWVKLARQGHLGLVGAVERAKDVGGTLDVITAENQGTKIRVSVNLKSHFKGTPADIEEIRT